MNRHQNNSERTPHVVAEPTLCRMIFESPPQMGGSVTHTLELSKFINSFCRRQFLILPRADVDTTTSDKSYPFTISRTDYIRFNWLRQLKEKRLFRWLPIAPLIALSFGFCSIPKLVNLNRRYGIDIIQAHGIYVGIAASLAGKLLRKPVIWMIHGSQDAYSEFADRFESLTLKLAAIAELPDHVIALDDGSTIPQKVSLVYGEGATIVHHAIDTSEFSPRLPDPEISQHLGLSAEDYVILSAHALIPVKGVEHAIRAFREFLDSSGNPRAYLVLAGEGGQRENLRKMADDLDIAKRVLFLGEVDSSKMPDYFSVCDAAVATSTYSNTNRSVQEAMACGKPVVAFDSGRVSNIILHLQTGLLAKSGDTEDMARQLLLLYRDRSLGRAIGARAREFIIRNRSWDSRIRIELAILRQLLMNERR